MDLVLITALEQGVGSQIQPMKPVDLVHGCGASGTFSSRGLWQHSLALLPWEEAPVVGHLPVPPQGKVAATGTMPVPLWKKSGSSDWIIVATFPPTSDLNWIIPACSLKRVLTREGNTKEAKECKEKPGK